MSHLALFIAIGLWAFLWTRQSFGVLVFFGLPGTLLHELAHWSVALLTGSRPSRLSLWPKRHENYWEFGYVTFEPGTWTAGWVALAPLWVLGPLAYWGLWIRPSTGLATDMLAGIGYGYAAWGCLPSSQDWLIALKYPLGTCLVGLVAYAMMEYARF